MGWARFFEKYVGELDTACGYRTTRTLFIRDRRLGFLLYSMQLAIFGYIMYQVFVLQVYMAASDFNGVVRLQLKAPYPSTYRWPQGAPPYCLGVASVPAAYPLSSTYAINGDGTFSKGGVQFQQRHCQFFDETTAVPIAETDRMFLTTETRLTLQATSPACASFDSLNCTFAPAYNRNNDNVTRRSFVADIEYFTLLIGAFCSLLFFFSFKQQQKGSLPPPPSHPLSLSSHACTHAPPNAARPQHECPHGGHSAHGAPNGGAAAGPRQVHGAGPLR